MVAWTAWETVGWIVVVPMLLLAVTQVIGFTSTRLLAILHALTPYLLLPAVPLTVYAVWRQSWALAATAAAVTVVVIVLSWPLVFPSTQRPGAAAPLRIVHSNVLFANDRLGEAAEAVLARPGDVLVITEYTPPVRDAFERSPLAAEWPHRIDHAEEIPGGTALWSRLPFTRQPPPNTMFATVIADVRLPDASTVRVVGVHAPTPTYDFARWRAELSGLADYANSGVATVVVGDLNASWWHPDFRDVLSAGFTDAHQAAGAGFSVSWPTGKLVPPFVRLDHALVTAALAVERVDDFDVPGSDHHAFDVTVRRAAAE